MRIALITLSIELIAGLFNLQGYQNYDAHTFGVKQQTVTVLKEESSKSENDLPLPLYLCYEIEIKEGSNEQLYRSREIRFTAQVKTRLLLTQHVALPHSHSVHAPKIPEPSTEDPFPFV